MKISLFLIACALILSSCKQSPNAKKQETPVEGQAAPSDSEERGLMAGSSVHVKTTAFPSYNPLFPPLSKTKEAFELSQDYPSTYNDKEVFAWEKIDFKKQPNDYAMAVLRYCLEGNVETNFKWQQNKTRKWFHAPWLHEGIGGREWMHGMTRERGTNKFEIHAKQDVELENWAVGVYNELGGYTLGRIWRTPDGKPDPSKAVFPRGSVAFKLLFTDAAVSKVPFLAGSFEWQGHIYPCEPYKCNKREIRTMRLLQIDIAVKDPRAPLGWVLGTFTYDASLKGKTPWDNIVPVGISWGDDPSVNALLNNVGSFLNPALKESWINPNLMEDIKKTKPEQAYMRHHGLGGRLNGPVDNPASSCISCHARAAVTAEGEPYSVMPKGAKRDKYTSENFKKYFAALKSGSYPITEGDKKFTTTDYSLQVAFGIRAYYQNLLDNQPKTRDIMAMERKLPELSRGE